MNKVFLKDLKVGDFFTRSSSELVRTSSIWIRGNYVRELKKFSCINYYDSNREIFLSGTALVRVEFEWFEDN